jgi:hypothetical protein
VSFLVFADMLSGRLFSPHPEWFFSGPGKKPLRHLKLGAAVRVD